MPLLMLTFTVSSNMVGRSPDKHSMPHSDVLSSSTCLLAELAVCPTPTSYCGSVLQAKQMKLPTYSSRRWITCHSVQRLHHNLHVCLFNILLVQSRAIKVMQLLLLLLLLLLNHVTFLLVSDFVYLKISQEDTVR